MTSEIADYLAEWPPHSVEITLYGATKEPYERVTKISGSYERCKKGIDLLLEREIPLGLKTMAMTINHNEIFQIKEYAEKLGVKFRYDPLLNPRLDGNKTPCNFRLSPEEVIKLDLADEKRVKEYRSDDSFNQNLLPDPLGYPLNQILMILLLSRSKGVLMHACGIDDRGSGYLFLGNSGHGKSTMAKLWFEKHATVLNDDRIVVREKNGEFWMYGTPWHGDYKELSPKGLTIHKIFFLHRGEKNLTVFQKGAEAVTMLLTRSFPPFWDKKGMAYTMDLCHCIVNKIPCYELSFEPDTRIVDLLRSM